MENYEFRREFVTKYFRYKQSFADFINWYNTEKPELTENCNNAILQLHAIWCKITRYASKKIFLDMTEYYPIITSELKHKHLCPWNNYINVDLEFGMYLASLMKN